MMRTATEQNRRRYPIAVTTALLAMACLPATTLAQPAAERATQSVPGVVEEVMVTASRREESLMDVPIAVTAFQGEALEKIGAEDIVYIAQSTPNMTLEVSRGTNTTLTAFIRGVGQQDPVAGFESGVGLYVDDVYLNRPQAAVLDIYDVERIEVLRGPQGTLYGRNTIGGAIKYVTRRIGDETTGRARATVGQHGQMDLVFNASTPLSDTVRVGGALAHLTRDGFGTNRNLPGVENYNKKVLGARGTVEWEPNDKWFLRLSADTIRDDSDPRQGHRLTVSNITAAPILSNVFDTRAGLNNPEQEVTAEGYSLLTEYRVSDEVTIRNILARREDESYSPIDFDSLPSDDLDVPVVYTNKQFSEELQLIYEGDRWSGVAGFYYLDANAFNAFDVILGVTGGVIGLPGLNAFTLGDVDTKTWSLFADFTFDWTDTVNATFGLRYTDDERSSRVLRQTMIGGTSSYFGGSAIPIATTSDFDGSESWDEFSPKISVNWQPNDDQNLYFSYSEGFKGGSFDPRGQTSLAPDLDGNGTVTDAEVDAFMGFDPETVKTYEIGLKSTLAGGRVTSNLAVFQSDYTDVQIPGSIGLDTDNDGIDDTFVGVTTNAADADIFGVEWEGFAILGQDISEAGDELTLAWAIGYIDAEYNEFIDAFGDDVADERVFQNTPEWTMSATLAYETPVNWFDKGGSFSVLTALAYRDDHSQFEVANPFLDQDSYTLFDLSLVWQDGDGKWRVGVHGKNLGDEEYKVAGYFFPTLGLEGTITAFYGNPRQVSATVERLW